jgi:2,4-dienoyl-CoA reductase (NADPH2)
LPKRCVTSARASRTALSKKLGTTPKAADLVKDFDEIVIATGVKPRIPEMAGIDHPMVLRYDDVLSGRKVPGPRVAIMGAGGIGFDVAVYLSQPKGTPKAGKFLDEWGVDRSGKSTGGLAKPAMERSPRKITLLQRKPTSAGRTLGLTTGWAIKAELAQRGVTILTGVQYERIDDRGLHYSQDGKPALLEVDNVVVCAGQESVRSLHDELTSLHAPVHVIGGAERAGELDALRAIDQGMRTALAL